MLRRIKELLLSNALDKVRPFVWIFYAALGIWGIIGWSFPNLATYVRPVMGDVLYQWWLTLHMIGAGTVLGAFVVETKTRSHASTTMRNKLWRAAIQSQAAGHACMFFALLAYVLSAVEMAAWGVATYSIVVITPYVIATVMLGLQALTKSITGRLT